MRVSKGILSAAAIVLLVPCVIPFARVALVGNTDYLPRVHHRQTVTLQPTMHDLTRQGQAYVVLNPVYMSRFDSHPVVGRFVRDLRSGALGYDTVFDRRSALPWWALARGVSIFRDEVESPLTNLDKVNPRITIFKRETPRG